MPTPKKPNSPTLLELLPLLGFKRKPNALDTWYLKLRPGVRKPEYKHGEICVELYDGQSGVVYGMYSEMETLPFNQLDKFMLAFGRVSQGMWAESLREILSESLDNITP